MKSNPVGILNGPMHPANFVQRAILNRKKPQRFIISMELEHGGWTPETQTDRILSRFILAQRCGLSVEVNTQTGKCVEAEFVLTTGEKLHDEFPIECVPFKDVSIQLLAPHRSTDMNISSAKRVAGAAGSAGVAFWATAEHLPWIGEVVLVGAVGAAWLAEKRVRFGIKWGENNNNYAVGSMIAYGMSIIDAIQSDAPIFPPEGDD